VQLEKNIKDSQIKNRIFSTDIEKVSGALREKMREIDDLK